VTDRADGTDGPGLRAEVGVTIGALDLDVELSVPNGAVVAVLGPNGAGKTTLLRALAGLVVLRSGRVELDGVVFEDAAAGTYVPTHLRPIGYVFQEYLLFPHLTVLENVAFGLRSRGVSRHDARARAQEWLARVGLADRAGDQPRALSGGQAQRVALARALAPRPALLLLDEPLAALDVAARADVRAELRSQLERFTGTRLLVTHDPLEAMALADRLVVVEGGRVTHDGPPDQIRRHPRTAYVATLVGLNLYRGRADGRRFVVTGGGELSIAPVEPVVGNALATIRPQAVTLHRAHPEGSARNVWSGPVASIDWHAERATVTVAGPVTLVAEVTAAALADLAVADGDTVWVSVKATDISVYPD
jgi:molybdate transport system ATP-binding protein